MNKEREISMDQLTKQDIEDLIHCRKKITEQPKKEMSLSDGHWRNGMKLQSDDGEHDFIVFMRKNEDFEENFSIGLICLPKHDGLVKSRHKTGCEFEHIFIIRYRLVEIFFR